MIHHNWFRRTLIATALTAALTVSAGAASFGVGVVNASALNLRAGATTDSASLTMAYRGAQIDVLEDAVNGWYKVMYQGQTGYMSAEYLVVTPMLDEVGEEEVPRAPAPYGNGKVTVDANSWLNIRSQPTAESARLGSVPNGAVLALDDSVDGWYLVTYGAITGYVSGDYIVATDEEPTVFEASTLGNTIAATALQYVGYPYVSGAAGPNAFDCSGFTSYIYRQYGYSINRVPADQMLNGTPVEKANLQPGDLVFFRGAGCPVAASHVGLYIGNGQFVHASTPSTGVKISSLYENYYMGVYVGARRIV